MNGSPSNLLRLLSPLIVLSLVGCGSGINSTPTQPQTKPSIAKQPANQSVPMGLTGSFTVQASGSSLQYQWSLNGTPIGGATSSTYTTHTTTFNDTGSVFTVTVSNSAGSVTSNPASLTITARAPKSGDLRFQQVDAASTINGYTWGSSGFGNYVACPVPGAGGNAQGLGGATGTGFFLSNSSCFWDFAPFNLPSGATGLDVGYAGEAMQNYQDVLNAPSSYFRFPGPSDSGSVITSLRLYSTYAFGLGFIHSENTSGFNRMEYTVPGSGLQALSTQEGLSGRVITAVSYDGVNATVFSYGWTGDPSTVYETDVEFATIDTATSLAQKLAAQGYIITASSSTGAADGSGVILIGTRVQGDTKPRPVLIGDSLSGTDDALLAQGYAIVAVVQKYQDNTLTLFNYIGER